MENKNIEDKIKELEKAKGNVLLLLRNSNKLVNMHGLEYWAGVVQRLREEIKGEL